MPFKPARQIDAILKQEYLEPTISWALRVVLALNVPLLVLPLYFGMSYGIIWAAFGAYMLALLDYRGQHYKKIIIQGCETILMFMAAMFGLLVGHSVWMSTVAMFIVGMLAAIIRNWSDYGSSMGVAAGFFFLFGIANPKPFPEALDYGFYLLAGCGWSMFITLVSFPLRPSSPVKRSVARIWKGNTELLDAIIAQQSLEENVQEEVTSKEMALRTTINKSIDLFKRQKGERATKSGHYNTIMELRRVAALFGAALSSLYEELEVLNKQEGKELRETELYKTLSAMSQASARLAIVSFTQRPDDLTMAKVRVKRSDIAISIFKETIENAGKKRENTALRHFASTLDKANAYLQQSISLLEELLNFKRSSYFENYRLTFNNFAAGLNIHVYIDFIRNLTNINSAQFRYALRVSIALCAGVFAFKFFNIDHGYWIPLTIMIVIQPYYGATRKKGIERTVGTVAGIVLGGLIMLLPLKHYEFVLLLIVVSFLVAYFLRNNYKVGVFFVTVMMVIMMQLAQQASWELIGWRVLSTLIGAALALLSSYVFFPVWEKERFPGLMAEALSEAKKYLKQVIDHYNKTLPADEAWYKNRRIAEAANNNVFACVQRMYEEPKYAQSEVDKCFAMVGVLVRMTREITSVGLLVNDHKDQTVSNGLEQYMLQINPVFDMAAAAVSGEDNAMKTPDFKMLKQSLSGTAFKSNEQIHFVKTELEKISFELASLV